MSSYPFAIARVNRSPEYKCFLSSHVNSFCLQHCHLSWLLFQYKPFLLIRFILSLAVFCLPSTIWAVSGKVEKEQEQQQDYHPKSFNLEMYQFDAHVNRREDWDNMSDSRHVIGQGDVPACDHYTFIGDQVDDKSLTFPPDHFLKKAFFMLVANYKHCNGKNIFRNIKITWSTGLRSLFSLASATTVNDDICRRTKTRK